MPLPWTTPRRRAGSGRAAAAASGPRRRAGRRDVQVIEVEPAAALEEVAETQRKLADALVRLGRTRDSDVKIGTTPKEEVLRIDKTVLYRYAPMVEKPLPVPILLTYALVGRYTMMDLQEDRSFVRNLLRAGH